MKINSSITDSIQKGPNPFLAALKKTRAQIEEQIESLTFMASSSSTSSSSKQPSHSIIPSFEPRNEFADSYDNFEIDQHLFKEPNSYVNVSAPSEPFTRSENSYTENSAYANHNISSLIHSNVTSCYCGLSCSVQTSRQEKSFGSKFFCCSLGQNSGIGCNFFQWEDPAMQSNFNQPVPSIYQIPENVKNHKIEIQHRFGHREFRQGQLECVEAALQGKDVFCLMPTGKRAHHDYFYSSAFLVSISKL